jgi:hypothetical protein
MYSFAKFLTDHIFLQNRDKKYIKNSKSCETIFLMRVAKVRNIIQKEQKL